MEMYMPLDINVIKSISENDKEFETDLLKEYNKKCHETIKNIKQAYLNKQFKTVSRLAHSLKGASKTVGADNMANLSYMIEKLDYNGNKYDFEKEIKKVEEEAILIEKYIEKLL